MRRAVISFRILDRMCRIFQPQFNLEVRHPPVIGVRQWQERRNFAGDWVLESRLSTFLRLKCLASKIEDASVRFLSHF